MVSLNWYLSLAGTDNEGTGHWWKPKNANWESRAALAHTPGSTHRPKRASKFWGGKRTWWEIRCDVEELPPPSCRGLCGSLPGAGGAHSGSLKTQTWQMWNSPTVGLQGHWFPPVYVYCSRPKLFIQTQPCLPEHCKWEHCMWLGDICFPFACFSFWFLSPLFSFSITVQLPRNRIPTNSRKIQSVHSV